MEIIVKMEASLTAEIIAQESKDRSKRRRSVGSSPIANSRSKSQIIEQVRVDSTMVTEMEYLNLMPADLSKIQDMNESSFFKGITNQSQSNKMAGVSS